ncbi:MAG: hypothetical protein U0704_09770 [Candidatus Eisenbacteria bacterium]
MHRPPSCSPIRALLVAALLACTGSARAHAAAPADSSIAFPSPADRRWQVGLARADRLQHGSLSAVLAAGLRLAGRSRGEAFAATLALGVLKELRDSRRTEFDVVDLGADAAGAALGSRTTTTTR